jgi:calcium/calmodulin-dependent protein kinase I
MKQIDHPNIVKMIDTFEDEGHYCLVMEMMQGGELFEQILNREQFSEKEAREAIRSIIDAINYCHSLNIVHRDIKPENLLLASKDLDLSSLKISDFGLARFVKAEQFAQTQCGTPGYVAPEIIMEQPYGKECDFWSIGVVLYILLSGSPPFFEDERADLFEKIKTASYEFEDATWGGISVEAKDLVTHILKANPAERYNCQQMMAHPWMSMNLEND